MPHARAAKDYSYRKVKYPKAATNFTKCQKAGGRIRTLAFLKGKSYRGEIKKKK